MDQADPLARYVLRRPICFCVFCCATRVSHPERTFVTNGHNDICSSCVDEAMFLINNKDRLSIPSMMESMRLDVKQRSQD